MPPPRRGNPTNLGRKGGFVLHVAITVATLVAVGITVVFLVRTYQRKQMILRREALQICEDGLMVALERLQQSPSWRDGVPPTAHGKGTYEVVIDEIGKGDPPRLLMTSTGRAGGVARQQVCRLELVIDNGDSIWVQQSIVPR